MEFCVIQSHQGLWIVVTNILDLPPQTVTDNQTEPHVCSAEYFRKTIVRERYLSDRNNHGFSLVRFNVDDATHASCISPGRFIEILAAAKRNVDVIGRHGIHNETAVLLPDTDNSGAEFFIRRILQKLEYPPSCVEYTISTYPRDNWNTLHLPPRESDGSYAAISDKAYSSIITSRSLPFWKRALDIIGAAAGIVLLLPLFLFVALLIKIVSPGPVLYIQKRVGRFGKSFDFFKFRTMAYDNDEGVHQSYLKTLIAPDENDDQPMLKIEHDGRIIPFGNFLRKSCIDELPQLFNVLKGDMSLVGPRPCIPYEAQEYLRWHSRRFDVIPGMTGLWQVSGKNRTTFKEMIRLDINYSLHSSLWLDLYIILKTPFAIFSQLLEKR